MVNSQNDSLIHRKSHWVTSKHAIVNSSGNYYLFTGLKPTKVKQTKHIWSYEANSEVISKGLVTW